MWPSRVLITRLVDWRSVSMVGACAPVFELLIKIALMLCGVFWVGAGVGVC